MGERWHSRAGRMAALGVLLLPGGTATAEIPNLSEKQLVQRAEAIVTGTLGHIYHRKETEGKYEYTHYVAEIVVDEVRSGDDIEAADRLYVRYWRKRFVGEGDPEPGHYGHRGVPKEGTRTIVFLKGNRKDGFDVLSPNGFGKLPTGTPRRAADDG